MTPSKWMAEAAVQCGRLGASLAHTSPDVASSLLLPWVCGVSMKITGVRKASGAVHLEVVAGGSKLVARKRTIAGRPDQFHVRKAALRLAEKTAHEVAFINSF